MGFGNHFVHNKLGSLRDEVVGRSDELKTHAMLFCLACRNAMRKHPRIVKQSTGLLEKVAKYNILYKYQYAKAINAEESMTIRILQNLNRRASYQADTIIGYLFKNQALSVEPPLATAFSVDEALANFTLNSILMFPFLSSQ